jgi:N-acetyl-1-D-myo-inositol-2-amino-2-deoxy-alpha-D-glucopyranoside deacetylase
VADALRGVTILAVLAHPDDEALACGGTLARAADAGAHVVLLCASRGELGHIGDPTLARDHLAEMRERELEASARTLGIAEVVLLDFPDGCLRWEEGLDAEIAEELASHRPDAVITFDSDGLYWHADHIGVHERTTRMVSQMGLDAPALYYVSMPLGSMRGVVEAAHAHGGAPPDQGLWGISPDAFGVAAPAPTMRIDVRAWADRKLAALRCHGTQGGEASPFGWIDESDVRRWLGVELFRRGPLGDQSALVLEQLEDGVEAIQPPSPTGSAGKNEP